jgi:HAD superfamily hydrolase (TIGR01509 family)
MNHIINETRRYMFKHLIWDVDGTLFNTYPAFTLAFSLAMIELQAPVPLDKIDRLARVSLGHCAKVLTADYGLPQEKLEASFDRQYCLIPVENQGPFPGVREACELVQAHGGLNLIVTHRRLESTQRLLEVHGMTELFKEVVSAQQGYPIKPDPTMFMVLIEKYGLKPGETLGVGDREIDVQAGAAAGCKTALFGSNNCTAHPDFRFTEFKELVGLLEG